MSTLAKINIFLFYSGKYFWAAIVTAETEIKINQEQKLDNEEWSPSSSTMWKVIGK